VAVITDFDCVSEWNVIHTAFPSGGPAELAVSAIPPARANSIVAVKPDADTVWWAASITW
jgi:hypothetical protein